MVGNTAGNLSGKKFGGGTRAGVATTEDRSLHGAIGESSTCCLMGARKSCVMARINGNGLSAASVCSTNDSISLRS